MTDYHVVYIETASDQDRHTISARIETACDNSAKEGWYLDETIADVAGGTTRGIWLVFVSGEEETAEGEFVAAAEEILSEREDRG